MVDNFKSSLLWQAIIALAGNVLYVTVGQVLGWWTICIGKIFASDSDFHQALMSEEQRDVLLKYYRYFDLATMLAGNILGPIPAGYIMDRFGRRRACMALNLASMTSWMLMYVGRHWGVLCVARVVHGMWIGVSFTVGPVYAGETAEKEVRGRVIGFQTLGLYTGITYMFTIYKYLSYGNLCLVALLTHGVAFFLFLILPETPYWSLMRDDEDTARKSLTRLREADKVEEELGRMRRVVKSQMGNPGPNTLLDVAARKESIIALVVGVIQSSSGFQFLYSMYMYLTLLNIMSPDIAYVVTFFPVYCFVAGIMGIMGLDLVGRKPMFIISCLGSSISMAAVSVWFALHDLTIRFQLIQVDISKHYFILVAGFLFHGVAFSFGLLFVSDLIQGEIFPVVIRSKAASISTVNRAFVSILLLGLYLSLAIGRIGEFMNYAICFLSGFLGILVCVFCTVETKGKTLEEVQDMVDEL